MEGPLAGQPLHLLFVCTANKLRSPTAANIFRNLPGFVARSAGIDAGCRQRASEGLLGWADLIFVMEKRHRDYLQRKFPDAIAGKRVITLRILDDYAYMDPELIDLLKTNLSAYLDLTEFRTEDCRGS